MFEYLCHKARIAAGLAFLSVVCSGIALADTELLKFNGDSFQATMIKRDDTEKESLVLVISKSQHTTSSVFSIDNPKRIVVDLIGASLKKNKDYVLEGSSIVEGIRFGAHSDKARIVIDVKGNGSLPYRTTESKGELSVILEESADRPAAEDVEETEEVEIIKEPASEELETTVEPTIIPTIIPTKKPIEVPTKVPTKEITTRPTETPLPTALPEKKPEKKEVQAEIDVPVFKENSKEEEIIDNPRREEIIEELMSDEPAAKPTLIPTKLPTKAPTLTPAPTAAITTVPTVIPKVIATAEAGQATVSSAATVMPSTQAVKGIKFGYLEGIKRKPVIKVELAKKSEFELQKNDEKSYTLKIKDCREFKPELKLVNFPPHDFVGFTFIQAKENNTDIDIRIGVERSKRISATPNENEIWIGLAEEEKIETQSMPKGGPSALTKSMSRGIR